MEMLVHNIAITDVVLNLNRQHDSDESHCLCRPRDSFLDSLSQRILQTLSEDTEVVSFPRLEELKIRTSLPIGFRLPTSSSLEIASQDFSNLRIHEKHSSRVESLTKDKRPLAIDHVFFPLLAALIPRWE
jgi:hypothetical protein